VKNGDLRFVTARSVEALFGVTIIANPLLVK
jgi:hypothetical protein